MTGARPHHSVVLENLSKAAARYRLDAHDSGTLVASRWLVLLVNTLGMQLQLWQSPEPVVREI